MDQQRTKREKIFDKFLSAYVAMGYAFTPLLDSLRSVIPISGAGAVWVLHFSAVKQLHPFGESRILPCFAWVFGAVRLLHPYRVKVQFVYCTPKVVKIAYIGYIEWWFVAPLLGTLTLLWGGKWVA